MGFLQTENPSKLLLGLGILDSVGFDAYTPLDFIIIKGLLHPWH